MESIVAAGFVDVKIEEKEESREVIKQWLPGSGAEDFVVSADITATKPVEVYGIVNNCDGGVIFEEEIGVGIDVVAFCMKTRK